MIELALAAANATEVEAQRCEAALLEHVEQVVYNLVVHRAAELRMRMQDHGNRRALVLGRLIAAFKTAGRSVENDFGHCDSNQTGRAEAGKGRRWGQAQTCLRLDGQGHGA
jgi:hypothetical protein